MQQNTASNSDAIKNRDTIENQGAIEHLLILGGGTAGWMAAAAISKVFQKSPMKITVIESSAIGTVGVGEATIPDIMNFNRVLGIDEREFLKFTQGTFKLGIEFADWLEPGRTYMHPFGRYGTAIGSVPFYHHWQRLHNLGQAKPLPEYSFNIQASYQNKFTPPVNIPNSPLREIDYAYHFDASLYAKFLRNFSIKHGVRHIDAQVTGVIKNPDSGYIQSLVLENGENITADFFIDCTGFRGVLIEQALHSGYDDWSHFLPCNSAVAVPSPRLDPLPPYTRATAQNAGWQWRIPLQHRTGNGYVYSSHFITDNQARDTLLNNLTGEALAEPRIVRFTTGVRRKAWNKNCVALGLSSGFLEPLESTSIHLIYDSIANLLSLFPTKYIQPELINKYNQLHIKSFTNIRDLLILHYWSNRREGDFWQHCRTMDIPERLKNRIDLYRSTGRIYREDNELFSDTSWISVLLGQGITTNRYNPIADTLPEPELMQRMDEILQVIRNASQPVPSHGDFIAKYCGSEN
jgi:tryptophan 7-halogenase